MLCVLATGHAQACSDAPRAFAVEAGSVHDALIAFGKQSGCSIVFDPALGRDLQVAALNARLQPRQALQQLLRDLPLSYQLGQGGVIAVVARAPEIIATARPARRAPHVEISMHVDKTPIDSIVVVADAPTGSRIRAADFQGFAQVDIVTRAELERSAHQSVGEVLRFLPAVSGNSTSTLVTNGGDGTATVTLRGLPAANTLVLIDGHRTNPDALGAQSVDLNTLPMAMIERIEVLKDGASSVYGSDAIAGVVNIVTRQDVTGLEMDIYDGVTQRGDLPTRQASAAGGWHDEQWSLSWGASAYRQGDIKSRNRDISRNADDRVRGGIDQRSTATIFPRVSIGDETLIRVAPGELRTEAASAAPFFRNATNEDRFNQRQFTSAVVPSNRWSLFTRGSLDTTLGRVRADVLRNRTDAINTLAPTPIFTGFSAEAIPIAADQSFNLFGVSLFDVRRRAVEFGARQVRNESDTWRGDVGWDFGAHDIEGSLQLSYHRTDATLLRTGGVDAARLRRSLGPAAECVVPCVPVNLLGGPGSITPAMVSYLATSANAKGASSLLGLTGDATLPIMTLPSGDLRIALGFDARRETISTSPDAQTRDNNAIGATGFGPTRGDRDVLEAYAEALVPVFSELRFAKSLDASIAVRASRYSDFGVTTNPKIALRYRPSSDWLVRVAYSKGFRAPTLQQLFSADEQSFAFLNDPCTNAANVGRFAGCTQAADPTLVQFLTLNGGNKRLLPEQSTTHTLGAVWAPQVLPGLTASVDYYRIDQHDVVDANAQFVVNQNAQFGRFPDRVRRDNNGNITKVSAQALNIGRRDVSGWDLALRYQVPPNAWGRFEFAFTAARTAKFQDRLTPDSPTEDHAGTFSDEASSGNGALPHWKTDLGMSWNFGAWEARYDIFYVSKLTELVPNVQRRRTIAPWRTQNVQLTYAGRLPLDARLSIGVINLFDEAPPFAAAAFNDSFDARTYDIAGRFTYVRANVLVE